MTVRSQRSVRRTTLASALLAALAALAALAPSAGAHAELTRSEPDAGSALSQPPRAVRLDFSEEISERFRSAAVLGARGRAVPGVRVVSGPGPKSLTVRLPKLPRGPYVVVWEALAEDDGHITSGTVAFGVGVTAPKVARPSTTAGEPPGMLEPALRWLDFSLLAVLIGGIAVALQLALAGSREDTAVRAELIAARRRVAGVAVVACALALVLGVLLLIRQAHNLQATLPPGSSLPDALATLLGTRWGALWMAHEVLLVWMVIPGLMLRGEYAREGRTLGRAGFLAGALALGLVTARALVGHAAAVGDSSLAVAADAVHVLAAALWIGGVLALAVALFPRGSGESRAVAGTLRRPFSLMAGLSVAALAVTGLYSAGAQVASVDGLLTTFYGETLLAKTGLVLLTGLIGATNGLLLRRFVSGRGGPAPSRARRLIVLELVLGLEIAVAAGILTSSSPPRGPEFAPPRAALVPSLARQHGDLLVTASVRPNRPGTNAVSVAASSSLRPPPARVDRASVTISAPGEPAQRVTLADIGGGRFTGTATLARDGRFAMAVEVRRAGQRISSGFGWTVASPDRARPVKVSAHPLAPLFDRIALLVLLLVVAWLAGSGWRRAGRTFTARALRA
jgi:copper transport protein